MKFVRRGRRPWRFVARGAAGVFLTALLLGLLADGSRAAAATNASTLRVRPAGVASWPAMRRADLRASQGPAAGDVGNLTLDFPAAGDGGASDPANPSGAVGPAHVMAMLSGEVRVQSRDGTLDESVPSATFWTAGSGLSGAPFGSRVQYDAAAERWIAAAAADAGLASSAVWLAVSASDDPTGDWTFYAFVAHEAGELWADFPALASSAKWIAITANMTTIENPPPSGISFKGAKMWVIGVPSALAGGDLDVGVFDTGFAHVPVGCEPLIFGCNAWSFSMTPAVAPGDSGKMYLIDNSGFSRDGLHLIRISEIDGTAAAPTWSPTADAAGPDPGTGFFPVIEDFETSLQDAAQAGSETRVDSGDFRISAAAATRNGRVWFTHSGGLPLNAVDRTAVFWYQIDPALLDSTGTPVVQYGIIDGGAGVHHIYPSIAVNRRDDACLGFTRSSASTFLEGVTAARAAADPAGELGPIEVVKSGEATYLKADVTSIVRWGKYSATVVDPLDDLSFWTLQAYAAADVGPDPEDDRWGTWWGYRQSVAGTTSTTMTSTTTSTSSTLSTTTTLAGAACGDPVPDAPGAGTFAGLVTASDALFILRAAVGSAACEACVCDVDANGAVAASDALTVLQRAIGIDVELSCPPCAAVRR